MFGQKNELLDAFDTFVELMIDEILPKHVTSFKSEADSNIWKELSNNENELSKSIRISNFPKYINIDFLILLCRFASGHGSGVNTGVVALRQD